MSLKGNMPLAFAEHDHESCVSDSLAKTNELCARRGLRMTPVRRKVLEILLKEHRAMGAYAILEQLREAGYGSQPPVAYRALEFLVDNGFAHKIERLNAFIACDHPGEGHSPTFLICRMCDTVAEAESARVAGALGAAAKTVGFQLEHTTLEAEGVCPECAGSHSV